MSGSGLALAKIPIEQDAAYWEWHVHLPGLPRPPPDEEDEDEFHDVQMNGESDDPYAIKFGVATRKDRNFYKLLQNVEDEGGTFVFQRKHVLDVSMHGQVARVFTQSSIPLFSFEPR